MLLVEPDGTFAGANPAAQRLLGQPVAALLERGVGHLASDLAVRWPLLMRRLASEREVTVDVETDATAPGRQSLRLVMSLVSVPGRHLIQVIAFDVTSHGHSSLVD